MFAALLAFQLLTLLLLALVFLRRPAAPDHRLEALLAADLPTRLAKQDAHRESLERQLREELARLRQESNTGALQMGETNGRRVDALRGELLNLLRVQSEALRIDLEAARAEQRTDAERLRKVTDAHLLTLGQQMQGFTVETNRHHAEGRESLHSRLNELTTTHANHQERLRATVEGRLDRLHESNASKLEEMRATVDEKLHATLQTRLTESFGAVTDQLTKVHSGLGEMTRLSAGVSDLSRIFTNVKSRGGFAEVQLGMLLAQMLAPNQFSRNVRVKPNTSEMVEYAVKLPLMNGEALLPIDAKFPREAWERLETAYATGTPAEIAAAGKAFETAIRTEGRRICDKYIAPPATTDFAIMFLPTEGLYAEVVRRDGMQADLQQSCRVTIAGPSTLSAILNSFQMGFHMLHLQQKGDEVWKVLAAARTQFEKFEGLMSRMDDQVSRVQKTIQEVGTRTRVINRTLRDVKVEDTSAALGRQEAMLAAGTLPLLSGSDPYED